ncbi:unnamed protein product [Cunninghamella echinulata]
MAKAKKKRPITQQIKIEKPENGRKYIKRNGGYGWHNWYQKASQLGQSKIRGGDSSKWLIQTLETHCLQLLKKNEKESISILEVGAVAPDNYKPYLKKYPIQVYPIDLNPQHESIHKQDFLTMKPFKQFDIISLSLVINFVGDPKDRGKMLLHTRDFLYNISQTSKLHHLFIVLPLPCINNSRYMSHDHFLSIMTSIGYSPIHHHFSHKLAYYLFELTSIPKPILAFKKKILKDGGGKNNFCIIIN